MSNHYRLIFAERMMHLVTAKEMREMDRRTIEDYGIPGRILMENAGRGATRALVNRFPGIVNQKVAILAGRGNNGGDGFVIARCLFEMGAKPFVYLLSLRTAVKGDAASNLKLLDPLKVPIIEIPDMETFLKEKTSISDYDLFIDAILGTGLNSDVTGFFKEFIEFINGLKKPVFSVDIPSGLNSDTGHPCGSCIRADATATFAFAKPAHFILPGASFTGDVEVIDIGIPAHIREEVGTSHFLLTREWAENQLQPRVGDAHKGNTGHLLIIGGSPGKTGAAAMTAASAMRTGAGLVTVAVPKSLNPIVETLSLESMTFPLPETQEGLIHESALNAIMDLMKGKKCLAIGPGMGVSTSVKKLLHDILTKIDIPVIIDADGLNNLAGNTQILKEVKIPLILTPHPGEMARLTDSSPQIVQKDRIGCARKFAVDFNVHVVLKGAGTVIAHPDGEVYINSSGNPGMASGGMGDVLTGVIGGLMAQGYAAESAARLGVYLHGAAADTLSTEIGPYGFLASEVANEIPMEIAKLNRDF